MVLMGTFAEKVLVAMSSKVNVLRGSHCSESWGVGYFQKSDWKNVLGDGKNFLPFFVGDLTP